MWAAFPGKLASRSLATRTRNTKASYARLPGIEKLGDRAHAAPVPLQKGLTHATLVFDVILGVNGYFQVVTS